MCKVMFSNVASNENNYNFIISSVVLSKTTEFTYTSIREEIRQLFGNITSSIENALKSCLLRLREDGFLSVLGSYYTVRTIC